ncbi:hypothetical protein [Thiomicrorhabdus chilensis]|uniref:hypothetical protein n=1 Tax=Thiomicrorhabdus chilensis TaxID=63656 RepID=UPI00048E8420|nr:hypothetical protein [Thiomicrorhabdus chilensis]
MEEPNWIDYVTALGALSTPVLVIILSAIGWKLRKGIERKIELEDKLRDDRVNIYNQILEPFVILLMTDTAWGMDKKNKGKDKNNVAISQMLSLDYRRLGFKMSLMGSDSVVRSYNNLMQYFYSKGDDIENPNESDLKEMLGLLGTFLLEIRRSMGNEATDLDNWDMLEWWMTDARRLRHT